VPPNNRPQPAALIRDGVVLDRLIARRRGGGPPRCPVRRPEVPLASRPAMQQPVPLAASSAERSAQLRVRLPARPTRSRAAPRPLRRVAQDTCITTAAAIRPVRRAADQSPPR
jgi:hypothetical protein